MYEKKLNKGNVSRCIDSTTNNRVHESSVLLNNISKPCSDLSPLLIKDSVSGRMAVVQRKIIDNRGVVLDKQSPLDKRINTIISYLEKEDSIPKMKDSDLKALVTTLLNSKFNESINNETLVEINEFLADIRKMYSFINKNDEKNIEEQNDSTEKKFKSFQKEFIRIEDDKEGEKIVAYAKNSSEHSDSQNNIILKEMGHYILLNEYNKTYNLGLNLPNPELIYNTSTKKFGIKMDYINGVDFAINNLEVGELENILIRKAEELGVVKMGWVKKTKDTILQTLHKLNENNIQIDDLQGILDKEGKWTIIDPLDVKKSEKSHSTSLHSGSFENQKDRDLTPDDFNKLIGLV